MDPNQFAQAIDQQGQVPAMVAEVARRKALAAVLEQAKVVDTAGQPVDLNEVTATDVASQLFDGRREGDHEGHDHGDHERSR